MLSTLKIIAFMLGHIPLGLAFLLGDTLGSVAFRLDKKRRKIALDNLDLAYGSSLSPAGKEAVIKALYRHLFRMLFEFMRIPWLKRESLKGYVECEGEDNLKDALAKGKGVILLTAHFGNWELLGAYMGLNGYTLDVVAREVDNPAFEEFVKWTRTRCGNRVIYKQRSMRKLLKCLGGNGIATILLDQNVAHAEGVFVDFFGTPACTNKNTAALAAAAGAAIVPAFIFREGAGHRLVIRPEIELSDTGDKAADSLENTARMTRAIEEMVRRSPQQWFWVHRRWKTRPPEEKKSAQA